MIAPGNERGFTLAELLVASAVTMVVLGGAVMLTSQVQNGYRYQVEDAAAEQEGRYALDWISRLIRGAGNNPYAIGADAVCPADPTEFEGIIFRPDGEKSIRLQADSNPPDGMLGGNAVDGCTQPNEDVTVSFDEDSNTITFRDNNLNPAPGAATVRTDAVIEDLEFIFRDSSHGAPLDSSDPDLADSVVYIETRVTVRTRSINPLTGLPNTRLLTQEVRVRGREY